MAITSTQISVRFLLLVSILSWNFFFPSKAFAQTSPTSLSISPAFQEIVLAQGQAAASTSVVLKNTTADRLTFDLRIIEINQVDEQGQISLINKPLGIIPDDPNYIVLPNKTIEVPAFTEQRVEMSAINRNDPEPGGHYLSLLATQQPPAASSSAVNLGISSFIILRKQGGERYHLSLLNPDFLQKTFRWNIPQQLSLTFTNQGNIHLKPQGQILVKDIFQKVIFEGTINENSQIIWPGSQRTVSVSLRKIRQNIPTLVYFVDIEGKSNEGEQTFQQSGLWIVLSPATLFIWLILPLLLLFLIVAKKRKRKI